MVVAPPDLVAVSLMLRPLRRGMVLPHSGKAVQGWWLNYLHRADPALSERHHAGSERRTYTCSGVEGISLEAPGAPVVVTPDSTYGVRITAWDPMTVMRLQVLIATPPPTLTIGEITFAIERAGSDVTTPPRSFRALVAEHLTTPRGPAGRTRDVTLRFLTATSFRQIGAAERRPEPLPFPVPGPIWRGLFDRWQASSPMPLKPTMRDLLATQVNIGAFALDSQRVLVNGLGDPARVGGGRWVVGAIGHCTYWAKADTDLGRVLHLLATFAEYTGVGQGTAFGLGQTRRGYSPDGHALQFTGRRQRSETVSDRVNGTDA